MSSRSRVGRRRPAEVRPDILVLCHGGRISSPQDAAYVLSRVDGIDGFYGASSMERLPVEVAIADTVRAFRAAIGARDRPGDPEVPIRDARSRSMTPPYRYILVGLGEFGARWATAFLPEAEARGLVRAVAAVDVDPARFSVAIDGLGLGTEDCFTSVDEALAARDCDFVIVVVPPAHHEAVVRSAVAAARARPVGETARRRPRRGCPDIAPRRRRWPETGRHDEPPIPAGQASPCRTSSTAAASVELNYVVVRFTANWRKDGDWGAFRHRMADPLLVEGAVHQLDILRGLTRSNARTVYAQSWNPPWGEYAGDSTALVIDRDGEWHALLV